MNANDLFKAVTELDLDPIKTKLMHVESGEGWSLEKANAVEKEYRRFLCLMKLFPEEETAPLVDVDTFWHYHILDTMKYAADCEQVFGYFLHHYPYVGLDGTEEDEQFRLASGERMRTLYEGIFGEAYPGSPTGHLEATAFCAGPLPRDGVQAGATAFCAGPLPRDGVKADATAFCAGPLPRDGVKARKTDIASAIAFCAGPLPRDGLTARKTDIASAIAFCAGPLPRDSLKARKTDIASAIAFCAGPLPRDSLNARARSTAS